MNQEEQTYDFPTEKVELPSKGLVYPETNPLSKGFILMRYMRAKEEDILTNQSFIQNGTVLDKLMQSLIVTKINYDDLIVGDKNAIMVAARVLGYGKDYTVSYAGEEENIDLSLLENKPFDETFVPKNGVNEFTFTTPSTGDVLTYKILTHGDEIKIKADLEGLKKINKEGNPELSTRLKYMITSINGNREQKDIRSYVDNTMLVQDSRALRKHIKSVQPDVNLTFMPKGSDKLIDIPIGINFFWPDA